MVKDPNNRIRQARRHAKLSQQGLATLVGVHRSAVAQWEKPGGPHPTAENLAKVALNTAVHFEWLATGRGRMTYAHDGHAKDEIPTFKLDLVAQSEAESRALAAMRRLSYLEQMALVEMMESFARVRQPTLKRRTAYSR
jgi:transcriptional regulator with XRE-family HTH domain